MASRRHISLIVIFTYILPVLAQNSTFDPLTLVNPLIGSDNGGNVFSGELNGSIFYFTPCLPASNKVPPYRTA